MTNIWKKILKKHLQLTRLSKDPFLILDYNKFNPLVDLYESNYKFDSKSFITALSLQSNEKITGFYNQSKTFSFLNLHLDSPYEELIFFIKNVEIEENYTILILQRYNCICPLIQREENINSFEHQIYQFTLFNNNQKFTSNLISPLDKKSGNIYFTDKKITFKDNQKNNITFKVTNTGINIKTTFKDKINTFDINIIDKIPKLNKPSLSCHFEKITHISKLKRIKFEDNQGLFEHRIHKYKSSSINVIIYNLTHIFKKEEKLQEAMFYISFNFGEIISIEIKVPKIKSFEYGILDNQISFDLLDYKDNIPILWKIKYKGIIYYLHKKNIISFNINQFEPIFIVSFEIINRNNNKSLGNAWVKYRNIITEKKIIKKKLNYLFRPLERPLIETYLSENLPFEAVLPTIIITSIIIFIIIFIIIIIVLWILTRIHHVQSPKHRQKPIYQSLNPQNSLSVLNDSHS